MRFVAPERHPRYISVAPLRVPKSGEKLSQMSGEKRSQMSGEKLSKRSGSLRLERSRGERVIRDRLGEATVVRAYVNRSVRTPAGSSGGGNRPIRSCEFVLPDQGGHVDGTRPNERDADGQDLQDRRIVRRRAHHRHVFVPLWRTRRSLAPGTGPEASCCMSCIGVGRTDR